MFPVKKNTTGAEKTGIRMITAGNTNLIGYRMCFSQDDNQSPHPPIHPHAILV
jgi:hypothetical protein